MSITIHQYYDEPAQRFQVDKAFTPFFTSAIAHYSVLRHAFQQKTYLACDYTGYVPLSFYEQTALSGQRFFHFMQYNPGFDVYLINCGINTQCALQNPWLTMSINQPALALLADKVFKQVHDINNLATLIIPMAQISDKGLWVGHQCFWFEFMAYAEKIHDYLNNCLTTEEKACFAGDHIIDSENYNLFMNNVLATFLASAGTKFTSLAYRYPMADFIKHYGVEKALRYYKALYYTEVS